MSTPDRIDELRAWIGSQSRTWLRSDVANSVTLAEALGSARAGVSGSTANPAVTGETLLFPILYYDRPKLTAGLFHQLVDACCEASRTGRSVTIVGAAIGRGDPSVEAGEVIHRLSNAFREAGFPTMSGGDLATLPDVASALSRRARLTSYTRRATDLPDLLTAAAVDVTGACAVYLSEGATAGRHVGRLTCIAPLGRRHTPGRPFASPPAYAKRLPAGTDQIWSAACTLGLTELSYLEESDRAELCAGVRAELEPLWRKLLRTGLTSHRGVESDEARRVVVMGSTRKAIAIPLFGAAYVSEATRSLIATAAAIGEVELIVDDVTPAVFYRNYRAEATRARFTDLAKAHRGSALFLSDLPAEVLHESINDALDGLTIADLAHAAPPGRKNRSRGTFTGYDVLHLAIMAVACGLRPEAALGTQAVNVPAIKTLARLHGIESVVVRSGPAGNAADHEFRLDASWLPAAVQPDAMEAQHED